jgi:magnesium transporter
MAVGSVLWIQAETGAATTCDPAAIADLLTRTDGFVWVDVEEPDEGAGVLLREVFGFHPMAVADCLERNHVSRLHHYRDHLFLVLHKPHAGDRGHVHYLELDQFVGPNYLVTTHGPRNPVVPLEALLTETRETHKRLLAGRIAPRSPWALSYAVVSALTNSDERVINEVAARVGRLEQRVMRQLDDDQPQAFLEELFTVRHALLTMHTMASQSMEIYSRAVRLTDSAPKADVRLLGDLKDQYQRLARISRSQLDFLQGVTDYYRTRTDTKMTIAAERLAVIAAVTLPVTAISSVVGMNVIVNGETDPVLLGVLLGVMTALSVLLLRWARRQGWW